jgi:acyl carrier protein
MALEAEAVLEGLKAIIVEETGLDAALIEPAKSFTDDLDIDSLSMMTIITLAEDQFDVEIPDDAARDLATVGDAVAYIVSA